MKKDNSTLSLKVKLRRSLLSEIENPVILETHGGYGAIFDACYSRVATGVVFETDEKKTCALVKQRPTWAVYESDCVGPISAGLAADVPVTLLDCDPYGEPWPVIDAFFESKRDFQPRMGVAVNDGLRQKCKLQAGWKVKSLAGIVEKFGNVALYDNYLQFCRILIEEKAAKAGYALRRWTGYHCGHNQAMTHYAAILEMTGNSRR